MSYNKWSVIALIAVALSVSAAEDVSRDTDVAAGARRAKILSERFAEYMKSSATTNEKKVTPLLSCKHSSKRIIYLFSKQYITNILVFTNIDSLYFFTFFFFI